MKKIFSFLIALILMCLALTAVCTADTPRSTSYPTATWNIATAGTYSFSGRTENETLYTNYRFTGCDSYTITMTNNNDEDQKVILRRASDGKKIDTFTVSAGETDYVYSFDTSYVWYIEFYVNSIIPKGCNFSGTVASAD